MEPSGRSLLLMQIHRRRACISRMRLRQQQHQPLRFQSYAPSSSGTCCCCTSSSTSCTSTSSASLLLRRPSHVGMCVPQQYPLLLQTAVFSSKSSSSNSSSKGIIVSSSKHRSSSSGKKLQTRRHKHVTMERPVRNPMHISAATTAYNSAAAAGTDLIQSGCLYTPETADPRLLAATACLCRRYDLIKDETLMERYARRGLLLVERSTPKQLSLLLHTLSKSVLLQPGNSSNSNNNSSSSCCCRVSTGFLVLLALAAQTAVRGGPLLPRSNPQDLALLLHSQAKIFGVYVQHEQQVLHALQQHKALLQQQEQQQQLLQQREEMRGSRANASDGQLQQLSKGQKQPVQEQQLQQRRKEKLREQQWRMQQGLHGSPGEMDNELLAAVATYPAAALLLLQQIADEIPHKLPYFELQQIACVSSSYVVLQRALLPPAAATPVLFAPPAGAAAAGTASVAALSKPPAAAALPAAAAICRYMPLLSLDLQNQAMELLPYADGRGVASLLQSFAAAAALNSSSKTKNGTNNHSTYHSTMMALAGRALQLEKQQQLTKQQQLLVAHALAVGGIKHPEILHLTAVAAATESNSSTDDAAAAADLYDEGSTRNNSSSRNSSCISLRLLLSTCTRSGRSCSQNVLQQAEQQVMQMWSQQQQKKDVLQREYLLLLAKGLQLVYRAPHCSNTFAAACAVQLHQLLQQTQHQQQASSSSSSLVYLSPQLLTVATKAVCTLQERFSANPLGQKQHAETAAVDSATMHSTDVAQSPHAEKAADPDIAGARRAAAATAKETVALISELPSLVGRQLLRCLHAFSCEAVAMLLLPVVRMQQQQRAGHQGQVQQEQQLLLLAHKMFGRAAEAVGRMRPLHIALTAKAIAAETQQQRQQQAVNPKRQQLLRRLLRRMRSSIPTQQQMECLETKAALQQLVECGMLQQISSSSSSSSEGASRRDLREYHAMLHAVNLRLGQLAEQQKQQQQPEQQQQIGGPAVSVSPLDESPFSPAVVLRKMKQQRLLLLQHQAEEQQQSSAGFRDSLEELAANTDAQLRELQQHVPLQAVETPCNGNNSSNSSHASVARLLAVDSTALYQLERRQDPHAASLAQLVQQRQQTEAAAAAAAAAAVKGGARDRQKRVGRASKYAATRERRSLQQQHVGAAEPKNTSTLAAATAAAHVAAEDCIGDSRLVIRSERLYAEMQRRGDNLSKLPFVDFDDTHAYKINN